MNFEGSVTVVNDIGGFGFIRRAEGKDVFFHFDDLPVETAPKDLITGTLVNFRLSGNSKKSRAICVTVKKR